MKQKYLNASGLKKNEDILIDRVSREVLIRCDFLSVYIAYPKYSA